jgi:hypothetical protein
LAPPPTSLFRRRLRAPRSAALQDYIHDVSGTRPHISTKQQDLVRAAAAAGLSAARQSEQAALANKSATQQPAAQEVRPVPFFGGLMGRGAGGGGGEQGVTMRGLPSNVGRAGVNAGPATPANAGLLRTVPTTAPSPEQEALHPGAPPPRAPGGAPAVQAPNRHAPPAAASPFGQPGVGGPLQGAPPVTLAALAGGSPGTVGSRALSMDPLLSWINTQHGRALTGDPRDLRSAPSAGAACPPRRAAPGARSWSIGS